MMEGSVANILEAMVHGDEWCSSNPLDSFATHLGSAFHISCGGH